MYFEKVGHGNNIVFLHGWGCSGQIFAPIAAKLTNHSCYLLDFNGFGKSPPPPKCGWSVEDYAEELLRFLVSNGILKATLVAHSFGCRVAMVFAAKYPSYISKILLVSPAGVRRFSLVRTVKIVRYKIAKFLCRLGCSQNTLWRFGSVDYLACDDNLKNTFVKVINQDLRIYARKIAAPTLIVSGRSDTETPLRDARLLCKCIKNGFLSEIDGGHFAFFANPASFASTVQYFEET